MPEPLTLLEQQVYHYLIDFLAQNTYQPSIREIAREFHIKSTKTVSDLLHALEHKGYIERDESRSRGVRLLGFSAAGGMRPVPLYGAVHAGTPAVATEDRKGFITMDRRFLPGDDVFFLRVEGDSMSGRGILDGDYVMVSPSTLAKDGDIVSARLAGKVTVKTLRQRGGTTVLEPAIPGEDEITIDHGQGVTIAGVVCGVFRPFWEQALTSSIPESRPVS
jgi:repressor LexA